MIFSATLSRKSVPGRTSDGSNAVLPRYPVCKPGESFRRMGKLYVYCVLYGYGFNVSTYVVAFVVVLVAVTYCEFIASALDDSHTDDSLIVLGELGYQFSQAIENSLLAHLHSNWNFPKHHLLLCHLLRLRREIGHPLSVSTAPFEHKHQP